MGQAREQQGESEVTGLGGSELRSSREPLAPCSSCVMLAPLPGEGWKVPPWGHDSLSAPALPTEREGSRGGGRWLEQCRGCPPQLLPRAPGSPLRAPPRGSLRPGPWDLQLLPPSRPAWESPAAASLSRRCRSSSAPLFLLSATSTLQRLHGKAWLPLRPRPRPAQVSCWHSRVLQPCPRARGGLRGARPCAFGGILVLGAWEEGAGDSEHPPFQL